MEREVLLIQTSMQKELASREWVHDLIRPIVDNTRETRHAVEMQARDMQVLIASHSKAMADRAQHEKEEHGAKLAATEAESKAKIAAIEQENAAKCAALEAQTWSNIIKNRWAPITAFIVGVAVLLSHLANYANAFLAFTNK
jgi:hypothetical protein